MGKLYSIKHNSGLKTVGRQTARLLTALYDRSQSTFTLADAEKITGLNSSLASSLLYKAVSRGLVSRLKPGLFVIVPPELGSNSEYAGDPYLTAIRLAERGSLFYFPCFGDGNTPHGDSASVCGVRLKLASESEAASFTERSSDLSSLSPSSILGP